MSDLSIKWRSPESGSWFDFDVSDLQVKTLASACYLFASKKIDVVAKVGGGYIVNSERLRKSYVKKGARVRTFEGILAAGGALLEQTFSQVGFGGAA